LEQVLVDTNLCDDSSSFPRLPWRDSSKANLSNL
jgi:hypothetical protein